MNDAVQDGAGGDGGFLPYESSIDLGSMLLTLAKYALVTFIVLLIFWALMHLLRRSLERTAGLGGRGRIRVVESARLYGDKLVHIVRVDGKEVPDGLIPRRHQLPGSAGEPWRGGAGADRSAAYASGVRPSGLPALPRGSGRHSAAGPRGVRQVQRVGFMRG